MFLCVFSLFFAIVEAGDKIVDTLHQVDLIVRDKVNEEEHNFGEDYTVYNRNDFPVYVSIRMIVSDNAQNLFVKESKEVGPGMIANLGSVVQEKITEPAKWRYQWVVAADKGSI